MSRMQSRSWQRAALASHCRLAVETPNPDFYHQVAGRYSVVLTVNSGYE
jgi:hypothetical protein